MDPSSSPFGSLLPPSDGSLPSRIGGYHVLRRLATGGTSDVLLARGAGPQGLERVVVLKLLLQQFRDDKSFERMFAREAAAYARLSHPAIVKLFDFFSDAGQLVMVLEHVDGLPLHKLRALLRPQGLAFDDRAAMFVAWRIFGALSAAHAAKDPQSGQFSPVIHRDVNPSNVLIPWDGQVKIADFGIAKVAGVDNENTQAGFIKGTYGYMAPEQVRGEAVTVRADVYAGCLLLWELLAGRKAIVRGKMSDLDVLRAMAEPSFPALATLRPELPRLLLEAVERGLQPDPDRRAIDATELANVLRAAANLDEGRQRLVDALAAVRAPSMSESPPAPTRRPPSVATPRGSFHGSTQQPTKPVAGPATARPPPHAPRLSPTVTPTMSAPPIAPQLTAKVRTVPPPPPGRVAPTMPPPAPVFARASVPTAPEFAPATPLAPTFLEPLAPSPAAVAWTPDPMSDGDSVAPSGWGGRGGMVVLASVLALACGVGLALVLWSRTRATAYSPPPVDRPSPKASASAAPAPQSSPAPTPTPVGSEAPASVAPASSSGTVTVAAAHGGHRVWIDKHIVGESPGTFAVSCGWHAVQVGSQGSVQNIRVPCGTDVEVR